MEVFIIESWPATVLAPNFCAPFEGGNVCLRLSGFVGEGVNTLSRERGSCVCTWALHSVFPLMFLVLGVVGVGVECSSVADETLSPLLSGEVLLAANFSVGSALRRFCWMAFYFFWRLFLPAHIVWHGFLQSEQKLMLALVRGLMVSPHTMQFVLPLGAMKSELKVRA